MRFRLDVAYHGAGFHGWQKQPGPRTVQGELEMWLGRLMGIGEGVTLIGAGRTDSGVHALHMPTHFNCARPIDTGVLFRRLQVALPDDIKALSLHRVADDFHARYSATSRRYVYRIRLKRWPFDRDREWQLHEYLNLDALHACARLVLGEHDFSGFCIGQSLKENNRCTVIESRWTEDGPLLTYTIRADRFLHEMVRLLVGTFVAAGRERWGPERVKEILNAARPGLCGDAAPPHALTLEEVSYPPGVGDPL